MICEKRLVDKFLEMVQINSPSGKESHMADKVEAELSDLGFEVVRDKAYKKIATDTGNLIATWQPTMQGGTPVFFSAHMDTVEPTDGIEIIQEGRIIRTDGRTVLGGDDKSGIAAILEAMRLIKEEGIPHPLIQVIITVSEEVGLSGADALDLSLLKAPMGYVLDGGCPVSTITNQAPSHDHFMVKITGKAAHAGASPEKGISAIQVAAAAISRMKLGRLDEETTANVGTIQGGAAKNIVPEVVEIGAEARSLNDAKLDTQVAHMRECFKTAAAEFKAKVDINIYRSSTAYNIPENHPVAQLALFAAKAIGMDAKLKSTGGGSDANIFNKHGIPSVVLGTGMDKVHTHEEQISIDDMMECTRLITSIVKQASE